MNDDCEINSNFFFNLLTEYKKLPYNSILGCPSISIEEPFYINASGSKKFNRLLLKFTPYYYRNSKIDDLMAITCETYTLSGRGTLIPVEIFNKIGIYDEELPQYGSDEDFILRAIKNGISVFITFKVYVYNHTQLTSIGSSYRKDNLIKFLMSFLNKYSVNSIQKQIIFYNKHGYKPFLPFYVIYFILGTLKSYLLRKR